MEINEAASILVIIESVFFSILLIVLIVATLAFMKLLKSVKRVVAKAEEAVESAEAAAAAFKHVSGPMGFFKMIQNIAELVNDHKKGKK